MKNIYLALITFALVSCGGAQSQKGASGSSSIASWIESSATSSAESSVESSSVSSVASSLASSSSGSLPARGSSGCGGSAKLATGVQSLTSDDTQRDYWLELPANYNPNNAYPVIIGLHWRGGSFEDIYGWNDFFGLKSLYGDSAIYLAPNGLDNGWANYGDRDIHFLRAMLSEVQQSVCTDTQRVFATGFSFGGMMSNAVGCQMGDVVRAVVPMAGSLWSGCAESSYKVAAMFVHAKDDNTVPYSAGEEARDVFLTRNGCSSTTQPLGDNGCVEYQGCATDKPVVWCGTETGGHWYPGFSAQETKTFFDRFQ